MKTKLSEYTPEEIKKLSNGCGGKGGLINPPEFLFHASCDKHDVLYSIGGTEADRKKDDETFYRYMKIDISNEKSYLKRVYYSIWAFTYYKAVRLFGSRYFNYHETV